MGGNGVASSFYVMKNKCHVLEGMVDVHQFLDAGLCGLFQKAW
jgi:hypothetical protein